MEEKIKKRAALCMLITLVDNNNGSINIDTDTIKRVFNDEDEVVKIEYANGEVALVADADFDTINNAVLKWKEDNPQMFTLITDGLSGEDSN